MAFFLCNFNGEKVYESYECDEDGNRKEGQSDNDFIQSTYDGSLRFFISLSALWETLGTDSVHEFIGPDFNIYSGIIEISPGGSSESMDYSLSKDLETVTSSINTPGHFV